MKKTSMISALIAASTVFGGNLVSAQERPLLKHHERFKQRLNKPQTQHYETSPGSIEGSAGQPTPPSSMSQSQPPAPIVSPGEAGSTPSAQPTPAIPDLTSPSINLPEGRFTSNNAIDTRGLLANGRTGSPLSGPLNTIGDFFAPGGSEIRIFEFQQSDSTTPLVAAPGSQFGRIKFADQNSPLPRDRFFFDYGLFHNARVSTDRPDVHRFVPGFEKTFLEKDCSIEIRVPMGVSLNSTQSQGAIGSEGAVFGDLGISLKALLLQRGNFLLTGGLSVQTPTSKDFVFNRFDGSESLRIANKQVRLLPYVATLRTNGDWTWQNWMQYDFAANSNDVFFDGQRVGTLQEQNYLNLTSSLSKWMFRDVQSETGWALTGEVHYNTTISESSVLTAPEFTAGTPGFKADIVNLTFGSTYVIGKTAFTTAYGTPITQDRGFDGEFRLLVNRFF